MFTLSRQLSLPSVRSGQVHFLKVQAITGSGKPRFMYRVAGFATTTLSSVNVMCVICTSSYRGKSGRENQSKILASCILSSRTPLGVLKMGLGATTGPFLTPMVSCSHSPFFPFDRRDRALCVTGSHLWKLSPAP